MSSPPTKRTWDAATGTWVFFDEMTGSWRNEQGGRVNRPRAADSTSERVQPSARPLGLEASRDADLVSALNRFQIQGNNSQSKGKEPGLPSRPSTSTDTVAEDAKTGFKTYWRIGAGQRYTDPTTRQTRDFNHKSIKKASDENAKRYRPRVDVCDKTLSNIPGKAWGRIIEVPMVLPPNSPSPGSATLGRSNDEGGLVRLRKFAIVDERPKGRETYRAVAIKTYNGDGVSNQIKSLHSQIYDGRKRPQLRSSETRLRTINGQKEDPIQEQAIRVETVLRTRSLDEMSRLDYCEIFEFQYGDPAVSLFGRIAEGYEQAFDSQWRRIRDIVARNSVPIALKQGDMRSVYTSLHETFDTGVASGSGAHPVTSGAPAPLRRDPDTGMTSLSKITVEEMTLRIRELREFAEKHGLEWKFDISRDGLERMASNPEFRAGQISWIRTNLSAQLESDSHDADDSDDDVSSARRAKELRARPDARGLAAFGHGELEHPVVSRDTPSRVQIDSNRLQAKVRALQDSDDSDDTLDSESE